MSLGTIRIQVEGALKFALGIRPIPGVLLDYRLRDVSLGKILVQLQSLPRLRVRFVIITDEIVTE